MNDKERAVTLLLEKMRLTQQAETERQEGSHAVDLLELSWTAEKLFEHLGHNTSGTTPTIVFQLLRGANKPLNVWPCRLTDEMQRQSEITNIYAACLVCGNSYGPLTADDIVQVIERVKRPTSWPEPDSGATWAGA